MASAICPSAMCSLLPFGFVLLACDAYHDLRWCLAPSSATKHQLRQYYINILTPRLLPIPFPGFLFPLYVIYVFIGVCPDWIGWSMLALYIPLCKRYYSIKRGQDDLRGWWMVVGIRVLMAFLTYEGLIERGCQMKDYKHNFVTFMKEANESSSAFKFMNNNATHSIPEL